MPSVIISGVGHEVCLQSRLRCHNTHTHTHIHTSPNGSTSQTRPVCSHNSTLEAQHDSSDYIFSICKTFFIHTKIFMGEIVFALKKTKQSMIHNWKKK